MENQNIREKNRSELDGNSMCVILEPIFLLGRIVNAEKVQSV